MSVKNQAVYMLILGQTVVVNMVLRYPANPRSTGLALENLEKIVVHSKRKLTRMDACLHGSPEPGISFEGHYLVSVGFFTALVSLSKH